MGVFKKPKPQELTPEQQELERLQLEGLRRAEAEIERRNLAQARGRRGRSLLLGPGNTEAGIPET